MSQSDGVGGFEASLPLVDLRAVHKDWPEATPQEARSCREGGRRCCRCQALLDAGVNPYTMEPLALYGKELYV